MNNLLLIFNFVLKIQLNDTYKQLTLIQHLHGRYQQSEIARSGLDL